MHNTIIFGPASTQSQRERRAKGGGEYVYAIPVLGHTEDFGADEKSHAVDTDCNQDLVPGAMKRLVVVTVDLERRT